MPDKVQVGFLGAGGIAQSHAYALDAMKYYYANAPSIHKIAVASPTLKSRSTFAKQFSFQEAIAPEEIFTRDDIDTLYILGPNETHTPQLLKAASIPTIQRIFVEKPVGTTAKDIQELEQLNSSPHGKFILMGFQYLQKSALRKALAHWQSGIFGEPIHFRAEYLHSSYLDPDYRKAHPKRLQSIPLNGAAADLGSHVLSLLTAFLGDSLTVRAAIASGHFDDVPKHSDLCTTALLEDNATGAAGTMIASRVSAGTGDHLSLEFSGDTGALLFNTARPDCYDYYIEDEGWRRLDVMSDYLPMSKYPADYAPSGWLRALVHHHYLFLDGELGISVLPDLTHGIQVQKLIQQIADKILER